MDRGVDGENGAKDRGMAEKWRGRGTPGQWTGTIRPESVQGFAGLDQAPELSAPDAWGGVTDHSNLSPKARMLAVLR